MSVRATIRITTFAYAAALPVIYTMWIINVLPQVLVHNFGFDKKEIATGVSYYFSSYYYGIIVGCFLWPAIGKFFYKRTSLLFGLCITAVLNYLMGISSSFLMVCVYRFLCGTMHNLNSVGKDFIYEFAHTPMHRQYGFSAKSAFNVASSSPDPTSASSSTPPWTAPSSASAPSSPSSTSSALSLSAWSSSWIIT